MPKQLVLILTVFAAATPSDAAVKPTLAGLSSLVDLTKKLAAVESAANDAAQKPATSEAAAEARPALAAQQQRAIVTSRSHPFPPSPDRLTLKKKAKWDRWTRSQYDGNPIYEANRLYYQRRAAQRGW